MNWLHWLYGLAGFALMLWLLLEDNTPPINALLMSLLIGPFVGVPFFVIVLVCFGNWPVIARDVWSFIRWPFVALSRPSPAVPHAAPQHEEKN